jgi:polyisoprenoid-binding protein YceI
MKLLSVVLLFVFTSSFSPAQAKEAYEINAKKAVKFTVDADVMMVDVTVIGEGADLTGKVEVLDGKASGQFVVDVTQFKTGMSSRDEHLQIALKSDKYKLSYLTFKDVKMQEGEYPFAGKLKLHGVEKPVSGIVQQKGKNVEASFIIKRKDFGIEIPATIMTKVGATVNDKVKIDISFTY